MLNGVKDDEVHRRIGADTPVSLRMNFPGAAEAGHVVTRHGRTDRLLDDEDREDTVARVPVVHLRELALHLEDVDAPFAVARVRVQLVRAGQRIQRPRHTARNWRGRRDGGGRVHGRIRIGRASRGGRAQGLVKGLGGVHDFGHGSRSGIRHLLSTLPIARAQGERDGDEDRHPNVQLLGHGNLLKGWPKRKTDPLYSDTLYFIFDWPSPPFCPLGPRIFNSEYLCTRFGHKYSRF